MKKTIFVCRRNIFRSQIAKGFYNILAHDGTRAESYGTQAAAGGYEGHLISEYPGMGDTIRILKTYGIDLSGETCKQLLPRHAENASRIIVLSEDEFIPDWLRKKDFEFWNIPNPQQITGEDVRKTIELIKGKVEELLLRKQ